MLIFVIDEFFNCCICGQVCVKYDSNGFLTHLFIFFLKTVKIYLKTYQKITPTIYLSTRQKKVNPNISTCQIMLWKAQKCNLIYLYYGRVELDNGSLLWRNKLAAVFPTRCMLKKKTAFSHQRISQRAARASLENQSGPIGPIASVVGSIPVFLKSYIIT